MDADNAVLEMHDMEKEKEIAAFVEKYGEDAVLDQIGLDFVIVNLRKRIVRFAAPLNDTPKSMATNAELRFVATKMLDITCGLYEGLAKLKTMTGKNKL